jgi:hypothetical protein
MYGTSVSLTLSRHTASFLQFEGITSLLPMDSKYSLSTHMKACLRISFTFSSITKRNHEGTKALDILKLKLILYSL